MTCERDFPCGGVLKRREARVPGAVSHARTKVVARAGPSRVRCLSPHRCVSPQRLRLARVARRPRVYHHPSTAPTGSTSDPPLTHSPSYRAGCRCEGRAAQWTELAQARGDRHGRAARAAPLQDGRALRALHPPEDQRGTSPLAKPKTAQSVPLHTALANDGVPLFFDDDDDDDAEASSSGGREVSRAERSRGNARRLFERLILSRAPTSIVDDERVSLPRP